MHILRRHGWEIPASRVTPEAAMLQWRGLLAGAAAATIVGSGLIRRAHAAPDAAGAPAATPAAAPRNPKYVAGRNLTPETDATTYNNYYEFSDDKNLWKDAQALKQRPWSIQLVGMLAKPRTIDIDDLFKQVQFEERIYRHRCVEAWAMTVPWTGFPLSQLLKIAEPLGSAKYVMFETAQDKVMSGLDAPFYPFPYVEGVTIAEAN